MELNVRPSYRVEANEQDITDMIADRLVSMNIIDATGLKSDSVDITLANHDPLNPLKLPPVGAELRVAIGYDGVVVDKGLFVVDELNLAGPPDRLTIVARATPQSVSESGEGSTRETLQTQKTRPWESGTTLGGMVSLIAEEHGLEAAVAASLGAIVLPHIDQVSESDINLLTRVARDYDAIAKPAGGKLLLARRGESITAGGGQALPVIELAPAEVTQWTVTLAQRVIVGSVEATWWNQTLAREETVTLGEGKPLRKLQNQYPDEATARKAAETELKQRARGGNTLQLTMPGRPEIVAEGRLTTGGFPDGANQEWLVTEVSHRITPRGYTSGIQAEQP